MESATASATRRAAAPGKLLPLPRNSVDAPGSAIVSRVTRRPFDKLVWSAVIGAVVGFAGQALADQACPLPIGSSIGGKESHDQVRGPDAKIASDKLAVAVNAPNHSRAVGPDNAAGVAINQPEAHHNTFTTDGGLIWVSLNSRQILIIDVSSDATTPRLVKTIDLDQINGTTLTLQQVHALPGRMLIAAGQGAHGTGHSALIEYSDEGEYIATHWMPPTRDNAELFGPGESFHVSGGTLEVQWAWGDFAPPLVRKRANSVSWQLRPDGPVSTAATRGTE